MSLSHFYHQPDLDNFVLVFTMGKVGSTALVRSLEAVQVFARHLQWATPTTQEFMDRAEASDPGAPERRLFNLQIRINTHRAWLALVDRDYASMLKVITVIRSPVEQILSHYFHGAVYERELNQLGVAITAENVRDYLIEAAECYLARPTMTLGALSAQLSRTDRRHVWFSWYVYNYLHWFDDEFRTFFPEKIIGGRMEDGYQIVGNALVLKFEQLQTVGERVVATYVQRPHFKLLRNNVGEDKSYGDLYREVRTILRFPSAFVDNLCGSRYVQHFYNASERQAMRERWSA